MPPKLLHHQMTRIAKYGVADENSRAGQQARLEKQARGRLREAAAAGHLAHAQSNWVAQSAELVVDEGRHLRGACCKAREHHQAHAEVLATLENIARRLDVELEVLSGGQESR